MNADKQTFDSHQFNAEFESDGYTDNVGSSDYFNVAFNLLIDLARIIDNDYSRSRKQIRSKADKKLKSVINKKKESLGIKTTDVIQYE